MGGEVQKGGDVYLWLIHVEVWQKTAKFCKSVIYNPSIKKKTKIMTSSAITSWQIEGEKVEEVTDFIFLSSKITADSDCSHGIERCSLLWRKAVTNLDSILKSRDITLPAKVHVVKAVVFLVVMYECESWTIKKAECWRRDAFELWCWRRLLRVP